MVISAWLLELAAIVPVSNVDAALFVLLKGTVERSIDL